MFSVAVFPNKLTFSVAWDVTRMLRVTSSGLRSLTNNPPLRGVSEAATTITAGEAIHHSTVTPTCEFSLGEAECPWQLVWWETILRTLSAGASCIFQRAPRSKSTLKCPLSIWGSEVKLPSGWRERKETETNWEAIRGQSHFSSLHLQVKLGMRRLSVTWFTQTEFTSSGWKRSHVSPSSGGTELHLSLPSAAQSWRGPVFVTSPLC